MLERERIIEIIAAVSAVLIMLGAMYWIGITYSDGNASVLDAEGGEMLVGVIIAFIFLLTAVGIGLAFVLNDPEDDLEPEDEELETDGKNTA